MKSTLYAAALICLLTCTTKAQDWDGQKHPYYTKMTGYIVMTTGDTSYGFIEHNDRSTNQDKAVFYPDINDTRNKTVYKPNQLKAYKVGDKIYRSIPYSGGLSSSTLKFNLLNSDGKIAIYHFYMKDEAKGLKMSNETAAEYDKRVHTETLVYQRANDKPFDQTGMVFGFNKKMAEMLADYPELAEKVKNKEKGYGMMQMFDIIKEYNDHFKK